MKNKTIPSLGFQACSDKTVRAIRFDGENLLWSRTVGDLSTASALIDSFFRQHEDGEILVETADGMDSFKMRTGADLIAVFDRATSVKELVARNDAQIAAVYAKHGLFGYGKVGAK